MEFELKSVLEGIRGTVEGYGPRIDAIQKQADAIDMKINASRFTGGADDPDQVLRKAFEESSEFSRMREIGKGKAAILIGDLNSIQMEQKLLTGAGIQGVSGVLMPQLVGSIVPIAQRRLFMRDLLYRGGKVSGNSVYYIKESAFANAASPQAGEGSLKAETTNTFTTVSKPVQTIAHWMSASRQVIDDLPALLAYIKTKLLYGLRYREEVEIVSGDGTGNHLSGLIPAATPFNTALLPAGSSKLDLLRRALQQVALVDEVPAGFYLLNPTDWADIETIKTEEGGTNKGRYIVGDPGAAGTGQPRLWGKPVVVTTAIAPGTFLCGSSESAELFDRMDATVELSYEDRDNFVRNAVTLLCEERTVLCIYRPGAFVTGSFSS